MLSKIRDDKGPLYFLNLIHAKNKDDQSKEARPFVVKKNEQALNIKVHFIKRINRINIKK